MTLFHHCLPLLLALAGLATLEAGGLKSFVPLQCNANLDQCGDSISEVPLSSLVDPNSQAEVVVPCGTCAVVDFNNGVVVTFPGGLDVIGALRVPSDADATFRTTHVIIQGLLQVDPPDVGVRFGFVMYEEPGAHREFKVFPHGENAEQCSDGCNVGRMPFAVVGGRLEVNGLRDPTCPSHVKLLDLDDTRRILTVGTHAASCWWDGLSSHGTEIYLTSPDKDMEYDHTASLVGGDINAGTLTVTEPLPERFGYTTVEATPDYPCRVASMRRSVFLTAEEEEVVGDVDGETDKFLIGGHMMVFFTPGVAQKFEGVEISNFGQQGNLGRYPVHFHICRDVYGSKVSKNVIHHSNQRCFIIHGTHNVTLYDNVAVNTFGHCYVLEDGYEIDNVFERNLGAHLKKPSRVLMNVDHTTENDRGPSVFWIMSPMNHWIENVAAGSIHSGFWFDTRRFVRGGSANIPGSNGFIPQQAPVKTFRDNVSHSNKLFGIQYYNPGWRPKGEESVIEGSIVYRNGWAGHFCHGNINIVLKGGIAADNRINVLNFQNLGFRVDGMTIIGYTQNYLDVLLNSKTFWSCKWPGSPNPNHIVTGVEMHPFFNNNGAQVHYSNMIFEGYDSGCPQAVPVRMNTQHIWYKVDYSPRSFVNTTFLGENQVQTRVSACNAVDYGVNSIAIHDKDGTLGPMDRLGTPGFLISDEDKISTFINGDGCDPLDGNGLGCLRYCPNACLRMIKVGVSNTYAMENMTMIISDGVREEEAYFTRTVSLGHTANHASTDGFYGAPLPAGIFEFTFKDRDSNKLVWPNYAEIQLQKPPDCIGYADETMVNLRKPEFDAERCNQLIVDGDLDGLPDPYGEMGSWKTGYMKLKLVRPGFGGSGAAIKAEGSCRGFYCTLAQWVDSSCFVSWTKFDFTAEVRLVDSEGNSTICDETNVWDCAVAYLELHYSSSNPKKHAIGRISYPGDMQNGWYQLSGQFIMNDNAELPVKAMIKWEYTTENVDYVVDNVRLWATKIDPSSEPTGQPTITPAPTKTSSPTFVEKNLAWRKPTYQSSTVSGLTSDLAVDGDTSGKTYTHTKGGYNYWEVDLTTTAIITRVKIYQRTDCGDVCYDRLSHLLIEIKDVRHFISATKVYDVELAPSIFEFNFDSVEGQIVRISGTSLETHGGILSFAEVEVYGKFLIEPPTPSPSGGPSMKPSWISMAPSTEPSTSNVPTITSPPTFVEKNLAWRKPTYQSSTVLGFTSDLAVDGDTSGKTYTHTGGGYNYWEVDLTTTAIITRVKIYQRTDCGVFCDDRLSHLLIEIRRSDDHVVEARDYDVELAPSIFEFNFDSVEGQVVRISGTSLEIHNGILSFAEVEVYGKFLTELPSPSPSALSTNLPTLSDTMSPSDSLTFPTPTPTNSPSSSPTSIPTNSLSSSPTSTLTMAPTGGDICAMGTKVNCALLGCVWKNSKCTACPGIGNKKEKKCVKAGCNWEADNEYKCQSCNTEEKKVDCWAKSCVWIKVKEIGQKMCTPCAGITKQKKCRNAKCAWSESKEKCASCVTLKKRKKCKAVNCSWNTKDKVCSRKN